MFTGIVGEVGTVAALASSRGVTELAVRSAVVGKEARVGDSISVNGVCLTVTAKDGDIVKFDCVPETVSRTTIGSLRKGDRVNLEGALKAGEPFGGHFVLGHVDCVAAIVSVERSGDRATYRISAPKAYARLLVAKGSVAIDGISLTLSDITEGSFAVHIIPETIARTALSSKGAGDRVNCEFDVLGKYAIGWRGEQGLTIDKLKEGGFA